MAILRVGHAVLKNRDLDKAKWFYGEVLGMQISSDQSPRGVFFRFGDYHHDIGIFKVSEEADLPKQDQVGLAHLALATDGIETVIALKKRLEEYGCKVEGALDHGMTHSLYFRDPDGNLLECYAEVPDYDWREKFEYKENLDLDAIAAE